ncbi:MAG: LapA family protein [Mariniphaga sp.]|nr:LapA family protein [Mariniphaga sp.]MDD4225261.1 LapA family protein [Mariniphaga sp.]
MHTIIIVALILAILLVIFTLQNAVGISITLFFWEIENVPLVLLLLGCILLGYILAVVYFYPRTGKLKKENREAQKLILKLESQIKTKEGMVKKTGVEGIELEIDDKESNTGFFGE